MENKEDYWKNKLTPEQYNVLRMKGTDAPFSGEFVDFDEEGVYSCVACGNVLFSSDTKYDSHCGWPSFYDLAAVDKVELHRDSSHGTVRTEVTCAKCGGHLGHVFDDGPKPTGMRYCINSVALEKTGK